MWGFAEMKMTPEQEAAYALDYDLARDSLKPEVQAEYDRQLDIRRSAGRRTAPDAVFPALGVQVRGESVERYAASLGTRPLGQIAGAEARLTDGSQAWSPGRAVFLPVGLAGLATKTKATAFVIFADGTYHETALNDNAAVRAAQAEAVKFNLMAATPAAPPAQQQEDVAAILRKLVSLHDEGLLTDEEFAAKRAEVIARI
jgi:putative oligomerization/nucleic acid binding protein